VVLSFVKFFFNIVLGISFFEFVSTFISKHVVLTEVCYVVTCPSAEFFLLFVEVSSAVHMKK
jgi:hypothetical protein